jgi:integrase
MQMENTNTSLFHDTRRAKKNGKYPVKIRLTYNRKQKYYPTNYDLTKTEFTKLYAKRVHQDFRETYDNIHDMVSKANDIVKDMAQFNWHKFETKFITPRADIMSVYAAYKVQISKFEKAGQLGTAMIYRCGLNSLSDFRPKLYFDDITEVFLREYEAWFLEQGNSKTTASIYLRGLRTIMNIAIEQGVIQKDNYPFSKHKYQLPATRNIKKALTLADIGKIQYHKPQGEAERTAKDYWLFSYYANGVNFKDIALLKQKNIKGEFIILERAKTTRTARSNGKSISVFMLPEIKAIMKRQGNTNKTPDSYIFPVLNDSKSPEDERRLILQFIKTTNKFMKRIGKELKIDMPLTTYAARHSCATILKRSGASVEFISETLGHSNVSTTRNYLADFELDTKKQFAEKLVPVSKNILKAV